MVALRALLYENSARGKFRPIVLLIVTVNPEVLLEGLVHLLSLAVTFWVMPRDKVQSDVEGLTEGAEEMKDKL